MVHSNALADYVSRMLKRKGLSTYDVERNSAGSISQSHVHRIKSGRIRNISTDKLRALARGLAVADEEVFAVVRDDQPQLSKIGEDWVRSLAGKLDKLSGFDREYALRLLKLFDHELEVMLRGKS